VRESSVLAADHQRAPFFDRIASRGRDYYVLTKPEVNLLILMTTSAGYYLGVRGTFRVAGLVNTLIL
jgi:heme O synthase-like polyprenyltransferase